MKINLSRLLFLGGLLTLGFSAAFFLTGHYGFGEKVVAFSFYFFCIGLLLYLVQYTNET